MKTGEWIEKLAEIGNGPPMSEEELDTWGGIIEKLKQAQGSWAAVFGPGVFLALNTLAVYGPPDDLQAVLHGESDV